MKVQYVRIGHLLNPYSIQIGEAYHQSGYLMLTIVFMTVSTISLLAQLANMLSWCLHCLHGSFGPLGERDFQAQG